MIEEVLDAISDIFAFHHDQMKAIDAAIKEEENRETKSARGWVCTNCNRSWPKEGFEDDLELYCPECGEPVTVDDGRRDDVARSGGQAAER